MSDVLIKVRVKDYSLDKNDPQIIEKILHVPSCDLQEDGVTDRHGDFWEWEGPHIWEYVKREVWTKDCTTTNPNHYNRKS